MYLVYLITSLIEFFVARQFFKKLINPASIYLLIWNGMIGLYEMRLVLFYDITLMAWLTVMLFQLVFVSGCILGSKYVIVQRHPVVADNEAILIRWILLLSLLAALAVIPNFINFIGKYSFNFMDKMNSIYNDRLTGERGYELIPYLGTLSYLALVFAGIYFRKFGFKKEILIPVVLVLCDTLPGGGRAGIIVEIFLILMPTLLYPSMRKKIIGKKQKLKVVILVSAIVIVLIAVFWGMSAVRSRWITTNQYMSPMMIKLFHFSPAIYKTYVYIVEPFVALSEYLKSPDFSFGINTFGMFYNILNKIGFQLDYERYQTVIYTPLQGNVATYIRELIQDFTYFGGLLATFIWSFTFGISYRMAIDKNSLKYEALSTILGTMTVLSFFVFFLRESFFWIMLLLLPIIVLFYGRLNFRCKSISRQVIIDKNK